MTSVGLKWTNGSLAILDSIEGADDSTPWCIDASGHLYGTSGATFVKWVGTAVTPLAGSGDDAFAQPMFCSQDGSVIVSRDGHWWTIGGATLAMLQPAAPYTSLEITGISDDGSIIIGSSGTQATVWLNGTPSLLPRLLGATNSAAFGCNADGSIVVGLDAGSNLAFSTVAYWVSGVEQILGGSGSAGEALAISSDNSIITGFFNEDVPCYWTLSDGVQHSMGGEVHESSVAPILNGGLPVLAGFFDSDSYRWIGATQSLLPRLAGGSFSQTAVNTDFGASCVSEDGSVVIGKGDNSTGVVYPLYWDAAGAVHQLPTTQIGITGYTSGVSRDGTIIFGNGDLVPPGQLELVTLLPMIQPDDLFAAESTQGADFGTTFSQFTISGWFCNEVNIQGPHGLNTPFFEMDFSPTFASFLFKDIDGNILFQASFTNGAPSQNPYNICFSVQTGTSNTVGVIWPIGGASTRLKSLVGGKISIPYQANADGSIVVGKCFVNGDAGHAVKWNGSVITELGNFPDRSQAMLCSQNGSIITGTAFTSDFSTDDSILWTSGGSSGSVLMPFTGYTNASASVLFFRGMSDDGSVITGSCNNGGAGVPTLWTNGVPSLLPDAVPSGLDSIVVSADGCSSNGSSLIFGNGLGQGSSGIIYLNLPVGVYWVGGTEYSLFTFLGTTINCCNAAGTILYGSIATNHAPGNVFVPVYWDDLTGAQTIHHIDIPAPYTFWRIVYCSDTGTVSVGNAQSGGVFAAVKATGTSAVLLPDLGFGSQAIACSHDGSIVVGNVTDIDGFSVPVYWDAGNVMHVLPYPNEAGSDYSNGQVTGISRDGTKAFGDATLQAYSFRGNGQPWIASNIIIQTPGNIYNGAA